MSHKKHKGDQRAIVSNTATADTAAGTDDVRIPVREEELVVGTQVQEEGRVRVHKDVVAERQTVDVPLQQERVIVERVPLSAVAPTADAFTEQDIEVPVMGERAVVGKQVKGVEEVRIRKDVVDQEQHVTGTVRKERVVVDDSTVR